MGVNECRGAVAGWGVEDRLRGNERAIAEVECPAGSEKSECSNRGEERDRERKHGKTVADG